MRHVENLVKRVPGAQDLWILGARYYPLHINLLKPTGYVMHQQV